MSFQDIFKSSFLENVTEFSLLDTCIGLAVALTSQLYLTVWAEGFRVSTAAILYPALLVTMMRESHRPDTGLVTGLCVVMMRLALDLAAGMPPGVSRRRVLPLL